VIPCRLPTVLPNYPRIDEFNFSLKNTLHGSMGSFFVSTRPLFPTVYFFTTATNRMRRTAAVVSIT
jgi:hypothetical protein